MPKTNSRTYCLCLYCDYDTKTEALHAMFAVKDKDLESFLDARDDIDDIMKSLGDGAEWQGSLAPISKYYWPDIDPPNRCATTTLAMACTVGFIP